MFTKDEIAKASAETLKENLQKVTEELQRIRYEAKSGTSKETDKIKKLKKCRAQILTVQNKISLTK